MARSKFYLYLLTIQIIGFFLAILPLLSPIYSNFADRFSYILGGYPIIFISSLTNWVFAIFYEIKNIKIETQITDWTRKQVSSTLQLVIYSALFILILLSLSDYPLLWYVCPVIFIMPIISIIKLIQAIKHNTNLYKKLAIINNMALIFLTVVSLAVISLMTIGLVGLAIIWGGGLH